MNLVLDQQTLTWLLVGGLIGGLAVYLIMALRYNRMRGMQESTLAYLRQQTEKQEADLQRSAEQNATLSRENADLNARLESERLRYQEQLQLLQQARETLSKEFENLANRIFEDKQTSFTRQSKQTLEAMVDPLRKEIGDFRKKVEDTYHKENTERNRLSGQIIELQKQAQRIGEDAVNLARALKGDSKMQGNWGEVILERILEESGLRKGREYETQVSLQDTEGRRRNPDVIVHLPDQRDIVVDAKVSLTDYERYCREEDLDERQRRLSRHLASLRGHVNSLSRKAYEQLPGINTLDFVLIFVPIEAAFMLAMEHDQTLFRDAYDQGIILVSPSTLLATLRTIHNIWRYEDQNRNAEKIAAQAGGLYDQFVLVVEALEEVGKHLERGQQAWSLTRKRLVDGKGNLVGRIEGLRTLGARTKRRVPGSLQETTDDPSSLPSS